MKQFTVSMALIGLAITLSTPTSFAGAEGKGGGDAVLCTPSMKANEKLRGLYSLDYVMALTANPEIIEEKPYDELSSALQVKLASTVLELAEDFENYKKFYRKKSMTAERSWVGGTHPLSDLKDEKLERDFELPANCKQVIQLVIRTPDSGKPSSYQQVLYKFDRARMDELAGRPLQRSFNDVHEWLRDFMTDAEKIRELNLFFHSPEFFAMNEDQMSKILQRYGLFFYRTSVVLKDRQEKNELSELRDKQAMCFRQIEPKQTDCEKYKHLLSCFSTFAAEVEAKNLGFAYRSQETTHLQDEQAVNGIAQASRHCR